jgi:hypothetical protein
MSLFAETTERDSAASWVLAHWRWQQTGTLGWSRVLSQCPHLAPWAANLGYRPVTVSCSQPAWLRVRGAHVTISPLSPRSGRAPHETQTSLEAGGDTWSSMKPRVDAAEMLPQDRGSGWGPRPARRG